VCEAARGDDADGHVTGKLQEFKAEGLQDKIDMSG
jgi:hypothetical protein